MNPLGLIGNIRLRSKMLLLVSVPFLALCFTSVGLLNQIQRELEATSRFESLSALALASSALLHETQKERGSSAGYLSSKGQKFSEILAAQRPLTDLRMGAYEDQLALLDASNYGDAFQTNLDELKKLFLEVPRIRSLVTSQSISVADEVAFYTSINTRLLNISDSLARFSPGGEIANSSAAFATFLQSKERAGIERAVLSSTFAKDSFTKASYDKFNNLVNTQSIYLAVFADMASAEQMRFFDSQMNHPSVEEVERMRAIAFSKADSGGFSVDPEYWFETITQKINLLKTVEDYLGEHVSTLAIDQHSEASSKLLETKIILSVAAFLSLLLAFVITHSMHSSLKKAVMLAKAIAGGDLTQKHLSKNKDEAGQLLRMLNVMQDELNKVISSSYSVSESVAAGAEQISVSSAQLTLKAEEQASKLETTACSTEEISTTIKRNADFTANARDVSKEARAEAEHGGEVVQKAINAMEDIDNASRKIASITAVIDEMAFQTNLLALNAAVEAARAGDHGRGFAVVAAEVRNLAGRSAEAAKEIKALIDDSVTKVEAGTQYVGESGAALDRIVDSVKSLNELISDIASASQEQSSGVDTINESMLHMNTITRDNTHIAKEANAAGQIMAEQAASLSNSLSFFYVRSSEDLADQKTTNAANDQLHESSRGFNASNRLMGSLRKKAANE